jgi:hypothetical protein
VLDEPFIKRVMTLVMSFDGSDGSEIEASNVAGSNRPFALEVADGLKYCARLSKVARTNHDRAAGKNNSRVEGFQVRIESKAEMYVTRAGLKSIKEERYVDAAHCISL